MRKDFFPKREDLIPSWCRNFAERLLASSGAFGVSPEEAARFNALRESFDGRYREWAVAVEAGIRSKSLTTSKREARAAVEADARRLSRLIHGVARVADEQLIRLGLNPRTGGGRNPAIGTPGSRPMLIVQSVVDRTIRVRLIDSEAPTRRGRPVGTSGAAVFIYFGPDNVPPGAATGWAFYDFATKPTLDVTFPDEVPAGKTVWIAAQWLSPRLERGPFSQPKNVNVQGGGVSGVGMLKAA